MASENVMKMTLLLSLSLLSVPHPALVSLTLCLCLNTEICKLQVGIGEGVSPSAATDLIARHVPNLDEECSYLNIDDVV